MNVSFSVPEVVDWGFGIVLSFKRRKDERFVIDVLLNVKKASYQEGDSNDHSKKANNF